MELIVSLAILAIIAAPLSGYFVKSAQINRMAREQLEAGQIAQQAIEDWKQASDINAVPTYTGAKYTLLATTAAVTNFVTGNTTAIPTHGQATSANIENYQYPGSVVPLAINGERAILQLITSGSETALRFETIPGVFNTITGVSSLNMVFNGSSSPVNFVTNAGSISSNVITSDYEVYFITDGRPLAFNASNQTQGTTATVYVVLPVNGTNSTTPNPQTEGIRFVRIRQQVPTDLNRLYQLTVQVTPIGKTVPLVTLVSYKRMK